MSPIPLEKTRDTLYVGRIEDERLLKEAEFYLAVKAQMPEAKLMEGVPRVVKIASRDVIDSVIGSAPSRRGADSRQPAAGTDPGPRRLQIF